MVIVDCETTGLNPRKNSIVSIGAVDFSDGRRQFYMECRIWDGAEVDKKALEINGFSEEQIRDPKKLALVEILVLFKQWLGQIGDRTLAGENPSFDRQCLVFSAEQYGIDFTVGHRTVDLHSLCYSEHLRRSVAPPTKDGKSDMNTDRILAYVGLPSEPKPHNALTGAKMEAEAFSRLIRREIFLDEFAGYPVPEELTGNWPYGPTHH